MVRHHAPIRHAGRVDPLRINRIVLYQLIDKVVDESNVVHAVLQRITATMTCISGQELTL